MFNDTISDVLTRIRNAGMVDSSTVRIPLTRMSQQLCHILEKEGFIASFQRDEATSEGPSFLTLHLKYSGPERKPCITNLRRLVHLDFVSIQAIKIFQKFLVEWVL